MKNSTEIETYYPVNLGELAIFFNHACLSTLMKSVSFQDPIKVLIPKFIIYKHVVSKIVEDDKKAKKRHLSMKRLAKEAKK